MTNDIYLVPNANIRNNVIVEDIAMFVYQINLH